MCHTITKVWVGRKLAVILQLISDKAMSFLEVKINGNV